MKPREDKEKLTTTASFEGIAYIKFMEKKECPSSSKTSCLSLSDLFFEKPLGYFFYTQANAEAVATKLAEQHGITKPAIEKRDEYFMFKLSAREFNQCFGSAGNNYSELLGVLVGMGYCTAKDLANYFSKKSDAFINHLLLIYFNDPLILHTLEHHTRCIFDSLIVRASPASLLNYLTASKHFVSHAAKHHPNLIPNILNHATEETFKKIIGMRVDVSNHDFYYHLKDNIEHYATSDILDPKHKIFLISLVLYHENRILRQQQEKVARLNSHIERLEYPPEEKKEEKKTELKPVTPSATLFSPATTRTDVAKIEKSLASYTRAP